MNFLRKNSQYILPLVVFLAYSVLCFIIPVQHDYSAYSRMWAQFLQNHHPYLDENGFFNGNAYGPLFILLAYLFSIHPVLPRLLFIILWFVTVFFILKLNTRKENLRSFWLILFLNPYFFIIFLAYGMNEAVNAFFLCFSLYFLNKEKEELSGFLLAVSVLFKFTPVFLVPFLFIGKNGLRWKFLLSTLVTLGLGFAASYLIWGKEILEPLQFATNRDPTFVSIFYILNHFFYVGDLSRNLTIVVLAVLFAIQFKLKLKPLPIAITVLLCVLSIYKVSLPQYQSLAIILIMLWLAIDKSFKLSMPIILYIVWVSAIMVLYIELNQFYGPMDWIRNFIGLPTFLLSGAAIVSILKQSKNT